jgi:hypothetical protein
MKKNCEVKKNCEDEKNCEDMKKTEQIKDVFIKKEKLNFHTLPYRLYIHKG